MHRPNTRSQHQSRKRGFDDDFSFGAPSPASSSPSPSYNSGAPRRPAASPIVASGPELEATVKWFNAEKGFGFVEMSDGSGDVFLHANSLQATGEQSVNTGATLRVKVGQGMKGRQVAEVLQVDHSTEQAAPPRRDFGGGAGGPGGGMRPSGPRAPRPGMGGGGGGGGFRREPDLSNAVEMTGIVKWYNPEKGFGFITPENGGKDVFVHASVLERSGLHTLANNQQVSMQVVQGQKGPEAASIRAM